ncbi:hypothetical protein K492DRAFT_208318 [Lichtheimia hyalospora FSU 10163]|nr:hypothetical protein K492DRAFT_208318 [Lichtheimia hyalospora FSU 10163]
MEAIDDYANENIARSLAYTVLEQRQQHNFTTLVPMASKLLAHRVRFLGVSSNDTSEPPSQDEWSNLIQWQKDDCQKIIETEWSSHDQLYRNPVYYKRLDAETLHCMVEFAAINHRRYAVVLILEEGATDISELKYHNTKAFSEEDWKTNVVKTWSESLEHAERDYMVPPSPEPVATANGHEAPDGYWGSWSSDEEDDLEIKGTRGHGHGDNKTSTSMDDKEEEESQDSEEEYYARWSQDPGTLTPGPTDDTVGETRDQETISNGPGLRTLQPYKVFQSLADTERQEMQEEYDTSFNPLYTVPSVPDLMDMHTSALQELTQMLHESLPPSSSSATMTTHAPPLSSTVDPLPKVVRSRENDIVSQQHVPGAFPLAPTTPPTHASSYGQETGRMFLEKSMRALIGVARLVGFKDTDILSIVKQIINEDNKAIA